MFRSGLQVLDEAFGSHAHNGFHAPAGSQVRKGRKRWRQGGSNPAHPKVDPIDKTKTEKTYFITAADLKEFPKYEKIWKEIFRLR